MTENEQALTAWINECLSGSPPIRSFDDLDDGCTFLELLVALWPESMPGGIPTFGTPLQNFRLAISSLETILPGKGIATSAISLGNDDPAWKPRRKDVLLCASLILSAAVRCPKRSEHTFQGLDERHADALEDIVKETCPVTSEEEASIGLLDQEGSPKKIRESSTPTSSLSPDRKVGVGQGLGRSEREERERQAEQERELLVQDLMMQKEILEAKCRTMARDVERQAESVRTWKSKWEECGHEAGRVGELERARDRYMRQAAECEEQNKRLREQSADVEAMRTEKIRLETQLELGCSRVAELEGKVQKMSEVKRRLDESRREVVRVQEDNTRLEAELSARREEVEAMRSEIAEKQACLEDRNRHAVALETQLQELRLRQRAAASCVAGSRPSSAGSGGGDSSALRERAARSEQEASELRERLAACDAGRVEKLERELEESRREAKALRQEAFEAKIRSDQREARESEEQRRKAAAAQRGAEEIAEAVRKEVDLRVGTIAAELEEARADNERFAENESALRDGLEQFRLDTAQKLERMRAFAGSLNDSAAELEADNAELRKRLVDSERTRRELVEQLRAQSSFMRRKQ